MPTLTGDVVANYKKNVKANGLGPRTVIVKLEKNNMTDAELNFVLNYLTTAHGDGSGTDGDGADAFVVAGLAGAESVVVDGITRTNQFVSGTSDEVTVALQGTGTVTKAGIEANDDNAGFTATIVATFDQNY